MSTKISVRAANEVMSEAVDRTHPSVSQTAGHISLAASVATLVFLAALHLLSPEFNPSSRMVSEYALGNYSLVLSLMFLAWALSCVALVFAIWRDVRTGGKIGLGLLLLSALGMSMAAVFDVNHNLHGLAAMIGMPNLPIAAVIVSVSLSRNSSWSSARWSLIGTALLTWAALILMNVGVFTGYSPTWEPNPDAWFGWANRFLIVAYALWLITVARRSLQLRSSHAS